ncbi:UDP-N-acetyl-alpha-D-muramoyl-L-alanyl-L-glutamate epimerase [soil metagenome]
MVFDEIVDLEDAPARWSDAAHEAARLVFLLAGVSYYKAAAPPVIDLGDTPVRDGETAFLRRFYLEGLGEYAYRNQLDLSGLSIEGGVPAGPPVDHQPTRGRPLVPFGGGIDSIVSVDTVVARHPGTALFVVSRRGARFEPIEQAAAHTGLPILRADRQLDPQILRSAQLGWRNGHVPVTGVLSAIAVLTAVLHDRDQVVMSNEWSSSIGNVDVDGQSINHQYSKSLAFEAGFRDVLAGSLTTPPAFFSFLRDRSELWVARRFAELTDFHPVFRSCNRAFHIDPVKRLDHWCGQCDKCCFIDLVLAPFLPAEALRGIFGGREPLEDEGLLPRFDSLLGIGPDFKPFECVGDVGECAAAVVLAADRADRQGQPVLQRLRGQVAVEGEQIDALLRPLGPSFVPDDYPRDAAHDQLV